MKTENKWVADKSLTVTTLYLYTNIQTDWPSCEMGFVSVQ